MSFRWRRTIGVVASTCAVCSWTIRSTERDVLDQQRAHDPAACQQRRLDAARAVSPETEDDVERCPEGHERAGNTYVDTHGHLVCNACRREKYAAHRYERAS